MKNIILDSEKIDKLLIRLAHEIVEKNKNLDNLYIVGIKSRGDVLSERIVEKIYKFTKIKVKSGYIDVTFYRDDFLSNLGSHKIGPSKLNFDVNGLNVILIDDVLYSGRTIRAAMDEIFSFGRPASIELGVLVDRGHRQLPIKASYIGKNIPTSKNEQVHVYVMDLDEKEEVVLIKHNKN
jgi:pyrimidine operon attenuation protein/uracil phosphoribosyltransferase